MELRHLRYFVAVAEELHFGRAALRLKLAQPPLSQQVKILENELGVKLLMRSSRKVALTSEGGVFLEHARQILAQAQTAKMAMQAARRGEIGRITIGFVTSAAYSLLPAVLREFTRQRPKVEVRCVEMGAEDQLAALQERQIQIAIMRLAPAVDHLKAELLTREPFVLALPTDHPRAGTPAAVLRGFAQEPFVLFPRAHAPAIYDAIIASCLKAGFSPRVTQEGAEIHTILALVAAGLGVALVPAWVQSLHMPGVVYRALPAGETAEAELLLVRRHDADSPLVDAFIEVAKKTARRAGD
ncbi:MAG: LysR family transcriptional regulator [Verrucomicrobia bacterium]|nr:LysR family transcriptional regulator [Verrucomicrobiota bacterium]